MNGQDTYAIANVGSTLLAATDTGLYRSSDTGKTWALATTNLVGLRTMVVYGTTVYVGRLASSSNAVARSDDRGITWTFIQGATPGVSRIAASGGNLFVGTSNSIYRLESGSSTWNLASTMPCAGSSPNILAALGDTIFVGKNDGVCRSVDGGMTWSVSWQKSLIWSLLIKGQYVYAGVPGGIGRSADRGITWTDLSTSLGANPNVLAAHGTLLFAGTPGGGIYVSENQGSSWIAIGDSITTSTLYGLTVFGGYVFAGAAQGQGPGLWRRPLSTLPVSLAPARRSASTDFTLSRATARFTLPAAAHVTVTVHDLAGRVMATLLSQRLPAGSHTHVLLDPGLPEGLYVYRLQAGTVLESRKILMSR